MRLLAAAPRALTPLALLAAALALVLPSGALADHSDLVLALLVLATALGIPAGELRSLRRHRTSVAVLSVAPLVVLTARRVADRPPVRCRRARRPARRRPVQLGGGDGRAGRAGRRRRDDRAGRGDRIADPRRAGGTAADRDAGRHLRPRRRWRHRPARPFRAGGDRAPGGRGRDPHAAAGPGRRRRAARRRCRAGRRAAGLRRAQRHRGRPRPGRRRWPLR